MWITPLREIRRPLLAGLGYLARGVLVRFAAAPLFGGGSVYGQADNVCVIIRIPPPQITNPSVVVLTNYEVRYYEQGGHSPVREFLDKLPRKAAAKCLTYIDLLAERGFSLPRNYSAKVQGDIWELRPEYGNVEYRLLYAWIEGRFFLIVHALAKKGRALSARDIGLAEDRVREVHEHFRRPEPR